MQQVYITGLGTLHITVINQSGIETHQIAEEHTTVCDREGLKGTSYQDMAKPNTEGNHSGTHNLGNNKLPYTYRSQHDIAQRTAQQTQWANWILDLGDSEEHTR